MSVSDDMQARLRARGIKPAFVCGCPRDAADLRVMCPDHWKLVAGDVRRLLMAELRAHRERGGKKPSLRLAELLEIARSEALYRAQGEGRW